MMSWPEKVFDALSTKEKEIVNEAIEQIEEILVLTGRSLSEIALAMIRKDIDWNKVNFIEKRGSSPSVET